MTDTTAVDTAATAPEATEAAPEQDVDTTAPEQWAAVPDVSQMTLDQLQSASTTLKGALERYNQEVAWRNAALSHVTAEIASRFNLTIPGTPARTALPQYPVDKVTTTYVPKTKKS